MHNLQLDLISTKNRKQYFEPVYNSFGFLFQQILIIKYYSLKRKIVHAEYIVLFVSNASSIFTFLDIKLFIKFVNNKYLLSFQCLHYVRRA